MQDDAGRQAPAPNAATTNRTAASTPESEFLRQQAEEARRAITDTLARMQQSLKDSADLKAWTRQHPWPTLGVAAAFGFLTAAALTPSLRPGRKRRIAALVDDLLAEKESDEASAAHGRPKQSAIRSLMSPLLKMFVGAVQSAIIAAATARFQQQPHEVSANGHQPAESDV